MSISVLIAVGIDNSTLMVTFMSALISSSGSYPSQSQYTSLFLYPSSHSSSCSSQSSPTTTTHTLTIIPAPSSISTTLMLVSKFRRVLLCIDA
eukprot:8898482-Alexandrium_andersonii.AAC.1